jgi:hypothetical protein
MAADEGLSDVVASDCESVASTTTRGDAPMRPHAARSVASLVLAISVGSFIAGMYLSTLNAEVASASGLRLDDALWYLSWIGFGVVGTLIARRRPESRIGWILAGITCSIYVPVLLQEYAIYGLLTRPGALLFPLAAGWIGKWGMVPAIGLVIALVLMFPGDRLRTRRQQALARVLVAVTTAMTVLLAIEPAPLRGDLEIYGPVILDHPAVDIAVRGVGGLLAVAAIVVLGDAISRFWRSRGVERQQFRWFLYAAGSFPVLFVATVFLEIHLLEEGVGFDPVVIAFLVGLTGMAIAIGIAVTRHGLYEIDRIVSRSVTYTLLVVILTAVYLGLVVGLQAALAPLTPGSELSVAASTLAVAALFQPVRRRVRGVVDRRFDRARYDARETIEGFAARLRDEVDLTELAEDLREVVAATVHPTSVDLWLPSEVRR